MNLTSPGFTADALTALQEWGVYGDATRVPNKRGVNSGLWPDSTRSMQTSKSELGSDVSRQRKCFGHQFPVSLELTQRARQRNVHVEGLDFTSTVRL